VLALSFGGPCAFARLALAFARQAGLRRAAFEERAR
jgi:hypothetical protein